MTPEEWNAFMHARAGLPRQGPGTPDDVLWALDHIGLSGEVDVFDAGCGPGGDTVALAEALPEAWIRAVDMSEPFVMQARDRVARFGDRVHLVVGNMDDPGGPYDLIWCAGALYFLGVTEGLTIWRAALKQGGHVVFSEPVALGPLSPTARVFWEDYPALTDLDGICLRITAAGYRVLAHRMVIGTPWAAYYKPMQARSDHLRATETDPLVLAAVTENQTEMDLWRAARDEIAYALLIVAPL